MAPLTFFARHLATDPISITSSLASHTLKSRSPAKPLPSSTRPVDPNYSPGTGTFDPRHIDNRGIFALFALIGAALVLASIWFFFWAKNGGFRFRKGDWEDYKSTVLRRKGPNGTTLSGATKTTRLGGGSVVAEGALDNDEKAWKRGPQQRGGGNIVGKQPRGNKNNDDADVRAYRHEKAARVGGLNRDSDAVVHDFESTAYSDSASQSETGFYVPINTPRTKKGTSNGRQQHSTPSPNKHKKSEFYGTPASNISTDSHRPLRPNAARPGSHDSTPTRSRNTSPRKTTTIPGSFYTDSLDFESRYSHSEAGVSDDSKGTKSYYHHTGGPGGDPGRRSRPGEGVGGFRRGHGRRDSLSDSEGETVLS